jgi:hypothetical protein
VKRLAVISALAISAIATTGCGNSEPLSETSIQSALEKLPYRYTYRHITYSGDGAVVAGTARLGRHRTYFAVIAGHPKVEGRVIPRQPLPNGHLQRGVDDEHGPGFVEKFVFTPTSIPRISEDILTATCVAATDDMERCRGL